MGLLKRAKSFVLRNTGKVIEKVGDVFNNYSLKDIGRQLIYDNPPYISKSTDVYSYNTSPDETAEIAKKCDEFRLGVKSQAEKIEDDYVDDLRTKINGFIDSFEDVGVPQSVMKNVVDLIDDDIDSGIRDQINSYISDNVSLASDEFVEILKMDDSKRNVETDHYIQKITKEAKIKLDRAYKKKRIVLMEKLYESLKEYYSDEKDIFEEQKNKICSLQSHQNDIEYFKKQAIDEVVDLNYMKCINMLTYSNI